MTRELRKPGATVGIIGGGQLGRMMCQAAAELGFRTVVLAPDEDAPAAQLCNRFICTTYDDIEGLRALEAATDVITYEFENIPADALDTIAARVLPPVNALRISGDRFAEKTFIREQGLPVADFVDIDGPDALERGLDVFGGTGILKTRRFGYDGKGQWRINADTDWRQNSAQMLAQPAILERAIPFTRELSVIIARGVDGQTACYPPIENQHENHILRRSIMPAEVDMEQAEAARHIGETLVARLDYVGILGVELFDTVEGLIINEIAPRVHNSGHVTADACAVGQFEQHIRAITGWPLGATDMHSQGEMTNILGHEIDNWAEFAGTPDTCVHLYGKPEAREGRKMGHFTRLAPLFRN
ncbi:MAG: 5-(carboxyamino)imidazole ribonucleotide synthase [Pseudomonadota bacterium]|nr:5-(carboxyamino)imidazole ribonucleotide synthase [Pseudomonadota bacterium]